MSKHSLSTIFEVTKGFPKFVGKTPPTDLVVKTFYDNDFIPALRYIGSLRPKTKAVQRELWLNKEGQDFILRIIERPILDKESAISR